MRIVNGRLAVLSIGLIAAVASGAVAAQLHRDRGSVPPWRPNVVDCRAAPLAHVHDPGRLVVKGRCATVTGIVTGVRMVSAYDDLKLTLTPDPRLMPLLPKVNRGVLVADVIATDQADVLIPPVGSRITAWGAWVLDKASRTAELLPAYHVNIDELHAGAAALAGHSVEKRGPAPDRSLRLVVDAPRRVEVGARIDVTIRAGWLQGGLIKPASEIRLFTEMTTRDGRGVRWKATMTHTNGVAVLHLVAIGVPATYTLTVYAAPSRQPATASAVIDVVRA